MLAGNQTEFKGKFKADQKGRDCVGDQSQRPRQTRQFEPRPDPVVDSNTLRLVRCTQPRSIPAIFRNRIRPHHEPSWVEALALRAHGLAARGQPPWIVFGSGVQSANPSGNSHSGHFQFNVAKTAWAS